MFCRNCGVENNGEARFCKGCGKPLNESVPAEEKTPQGMDTTVRYNIKPTYNWGYKIVTVGLGSLFFALFILFYLFEEYTMFVLIGYLPIVILAFALFIGGRLLFGKLQYNKLNYNFYSDRVEYIDGFLNVSEKELKYKNVRETTMTQNIIERLFGIGTIKIFSNASSGMSKWGANNQRNLNGITMHCVTNVREQYAKVKELVDLGSKED